MSDIFEIRVHPVSAISRRSRRAAFWQLASSKSSRKRSQTGVDPHHRLNGNWRVAGLGARVARLDYGDKRSARHHALHLVEKLALAGLLRQQLRAHAKLPIAVVRVIVMA
jgi:hypothetical protein